MYATRTFVNCLSLRLKVLASIIALYAYNINAKLRVLHLPRPEKTVAAGSQDLGSISYRVLTPGVDVDSVTQGNVDMELNMNTTSYPRCHRRSWVSKRR